MTAAANLLPMAAGVLLLGEQMPPGGLGLALRVCAFAAAVAGAWALSARSAARPDGRVARRAGALAATHAPDRGTLMAAMHHRRDAGDEGRTIRVVAADDHAASLRATTETLTRAGLDVVGVSDERPGRDRRRAHVLA